ncbi:MAG: metallophosphoesterase family protein, partial [Sinobacteraceae bacterium]|nr:metallophosphoesterase family protein [Nevskiaceae bacterium]
MRPIAIILGAAFAPAVFGQQVTFAPYLQLGDNGTFGPTDQIVIAWQTNEGSPNVSAYKVEFSAVGDEDSRFESGRHQRVVVPNARVIDNYLAADPALPTIPGAYGPHSNYTAVLTGLRYDTEYQYRVTGPGLPGNGFASSFHTRKRDSHFSFVVVGDEGFFPVVPNSANPAVVVNYEARIAHLIHNVANLSVAGVPRLPESDLILDTGDNVYTVGSEDNYRDFFFPVWNSDVDSNETGAPILRNRLFLPVDGNHDQGSTGVSANLLADNAAPTFSGNLSGGDALSFFNDFYFPQNGPAGFDIQNAWNVTTSVPTGFTLTYQGKSYTSPAAIAAFRSSTQVDTGKGPSVQIDHQSNYSFDYGNAHFLYLDANPHLFNDNLPGGSVFNTAPPTFVPYPTALGQWVINDLDSSKQPWKVVVYHQPAFTSGDATLVNNQMRHIAKLLEDHGVNVVFNGHDHNYQRSLPIRATDRTGATPSTTAGSPAVLVDQQFDGSQHTVPDGVLYLIEGAGGNRDFDGDLAPPRGSGLGVDQDDSATGMHVDEPGLTVPQGPASWLDTNLTNPEMINFFPNAGAGTKITARLKSKVFSFGDVLVDGNKLTLYQIS